MPMYEYGCDACEVTAERYEPLVDKQEPPDCCDCGKPMVKLISACNFDLRGEGFYATEHGPKAHKLSITSQARRAAREVKERGIVASRPPAKAPPTESMIPEMKKEYGSKTWKDHVPGARRKK